MANSTPENVEQIQPNALGNPILFQLKDFLEADDPIETIDLLSVIRRSFRGREKQIVLLALTVMIISGICAFLIVTPVYQSEGLVRVLAREQTILYTDSDDSRLRLYDAFVSVEMQLLQSRPVLETALSDLRSQTTNLTPPKNLLDLISILGISNKKGLVTITARSQDSALSAAVVNAVLAAYEASNEAARSRQFEVRRRELSTRESELEESLTTLNAEYLHIGGEHDVGTLSRAHITKTAQLEVLEERIVELDNTIVVMRATGRADTEISTEVLRATLLDRTTAELTLDRAYRLATLETLRGRYRASHPRLRGAEVELKSIETAIEERRQQIAILSKAGALTSGTTEHSLDELSALKIKLAARRQAIRAEARELSSKRIRIRSVATELARVGRLLEETKRALEAVLVESHNNLARAIVVVARGKISDKPIEDKRKPAALAAAVFSGLAVLISITAGTMLAGKIRFSDDFDAHVRVLLAAIAAHDNSLDRPLEAAAHEMRNELDLRWPVSVKEPLIIGVLASAVGAGVTSLVDSMARTYAAPNRSVLIVDADLTGAGLSKLHGMTEAPGLMDVANAEINLTEAVKHLQVPGGSVDLLATGTTETSDTAKSYFPELSVEEMDSLLDRLRENYKVIIIDFGVLARGRQSAIGAALVDRVVMVTACGEAKSHINKALKLLQRLTPEHLLFILNRAMPQDPAFAVNTSDSDKTAAKEKSWFYQFANTWQKEQ